MEFYFVIAVIIVILIIVLKNIYVVQRIEGVKVFVQKAEVPAEQR